jgi:lysozyme
MQTSNSGRRLIEQFEGLNLNAYNDGTGTLTIGYGHTTSAGDPKVTKSLKITQDQADQILSSDLGKVEAQINSLVTVPLNQNQFDALSSFQFNTGALARSTVLKKLNSGDTNGAADALLLYNRAGGRVLSGLVRRRQAEREMFLAPINSTKVSGPVVVGTGTLGGTVSGYLGWFQHHPVITVLSILALVIVVGGIVHFIHNRKVL